MTDDFSVFFSCSLGNNYTTALPIILVFLSNAGLQVKLTNFWEWH